MLYFRYHSTNCFFIRSSTNEDLLAIDAGWPGTLFEYARNMKSIGCHLERIAWALVTHFHMDHAGLVSEFVERGIKCLVFENQLASIDAMEKTIEKNYGEYRPIDKARLQRINTQNSRTTLKEMGLSGEVLITDYHSQDSVSYITDEREAIVGDLFPATQVMPDDRRFWNTWELLGRKGVKTIYPSHAPAFQMNEIA